MEPGGGALREETGTKDLDQIRGHAGSMESRYRLTSKSVGKREVANRQVACSLVRAAAGWAQWELESQVRCR